MNNDNAHAMWEKKNREREKGNPETHLKSITKKEKKNEKDLSYLCGRHHCLCA